MKPARILMFGALLLGPSVGYAQPLMTPPANLAPAPVSTAQPIIPSNESCLPAGAFEQAASPAENDRLQLGASYLLWWLSRDRASLPVLTTGGAGAGILGQPDTTVLLRAGDVGVRDPYSGGDFRAHYWLDNDQRFGLDARFFFLGKQSASRSAGGDPTGNPLLSIPFNDLNPILPGPSFTMVATPGASTGTVRFESTTRLWGFETNVDAAVIDWDGFQLAGLIGFRYMDLLENYSIVQNVVAVPPNQLLALQGNLIPATDSLRISDGFHTRNQFYGVNLVGRAQYEMPSGLTLGVIGRVALGSTHQVLNVNGTTDQLTPGQSAPVATANGGLFAQPNTSGRQSKDVFSVIPEVEVRLAYAVTEWAKVTLGYNFLYWSNVVRPASQIPGTINTTTAPSQATFGGGGPAAPLPGFHSTDLTAHGLNVGLALSF